MSTSAWLKMALYTSAACRYLTDSLRQNIDLLAFISELEMESTIGRDFSNQVKSSQKHPANGRCSKTTYHDSTDSWLRIIKCIFLFIQGSKREVRVDKGNIPSSIIGCYKIFKRTGLFGENIPS